MDVCFYALFCAAACIDGWADDTSSDERHDHDFLWTSTCRRCGILGQTVAGYDYDEELMM
jgi:hypothetical protein